jgi:heme/copper-type cytochrome/quinol oxidase subunit 3
MAVVDTDTSRKLPTFSIGANSPGWWAIVMLMLIESTVFAGLIASYFYLFANATVWPPDGITPPDIGLPIIYTAILLGSAVPAWLADRALANGDIGGLKLWQAIGTAMLIVFLFLKYYEYSNLDYLWDENAYSSILWLIAGFHSAHVALVLIKTLGTQTLAWRGFFHQRRRSAVQGTTLYWVFVVGLWIPLFATVYLFPNYA